MRIKDCIYGQVRSTEDEDLSQGVLMPHVVPNAWTDHIIQQQLFTWTNHTGMNPLWADSPVEDVTYFRYGEMLSEVDGSRTPVEWDEFVAAQGPDFTNVDIALKIKILAQWYLIHQFLNTPDALSYDYLILRQHDTSFKIKEDPHTFGHEFNKVKTFFFHTSKREAPGYSSHIMVKHLYENDTIHDRSLINAIGGNFFMFDKQAVAILRSNFFQQIAKQADFYTNTLIPDCRQAARVPGTLLMDVAIKNDIHLVNMGEKFFWKPPRRLQERFKDHSCMNKNRKTWD